ncbi:hypothetical protein FKM82_026093, partial [Ascaphus truei]
MRELEQAQFSLELLKVRSGELSPSEERRWSAEIALDRLPDTPESEGSLGSLEHISGEENQQPSEGRLAASENPPSSPTHRLISTASEGSRDSSSHEPPASPTYGTTSTPSRGSLNSPTQGPPTSPMQRLQSSPSYNALSYSDHEPPSSLTYRPKNSPSHRSLSSSTPGPSISRFKGPPSSPPHGPHKSHSNGVPNAASPGSPGPVNVSSNGPMSSPSQAALLDSPTPLQVTTPTRGPTSPPQDAPSQLPEGFLSRTPPSPASSAVDISWGASSTWRLKPPGPELSESAPAKTSDSVFYKTLPREPLLSNSLPTFYVPPQEALRGQQELSEPGGFPSESVLQRLQKLNEEKLELQKQLQQQKERQMMEQIRKEKQELERQRRMMEQRGDPNCPQDASMRASKKPSDRPQSLLIQSPHCKGPPPKSTVEIKGLSVGGKGGPASHGDRPTSMYLEQRGGRDPLRGDPTGETGDMGRRPWLHGPGNSGIFFTPKGNVSSDSDAPSARPHRLARSDPAKRLDATEPSGASE